jgi:hypothetical protein
VPGRVSVASGDAQSLPFSNSSPEVIRVTVMMYVRYPPSMKRNIHHWSYSQRRWHLDEYYVRVADVRNRGSLVGFKPDSGEKMRQSQIALVTYYCHRRWRLGAPWIANASISGSS